MTNFSTPVKVVFASFFLSLALWASSFHGKLPAITDVFLYTYPSQTVNQGEWSHGTIPLWDPYTGCGTPQLSNSLSACFYPPFWVWNLTGLSHWILWMSLLHSGLAFLGFYFWAKERKIFPLWAALGAISFAGSLHMVRCWGYPVFSATQAWTPWVFWASARYLEKGRAGGWFTLALLLGFQVLAGYPFFVFYTLLFLASWVWVHRAPFRRKAMLATAVGFAFAWTSVHWLPFIDGLCHSTRGGWGTPNQFPFFSKAGEYLSLLSPAILGNPETLGYLGQSANANFMMYFGLIPLLAWVYCLLAQGRQGKRFWGIATGVWLCWLMGAHFPLWKMIPEALLETLNPSKAVGIFIFAACTSAGFALTDFFRDRWSERKRWAVCGCIGLIWLLDILLIPFRVVHPVPDPFQKPQNQNEASRIQAACGGQRLVSLHSKGRDLF